MTTTDVVLVDTPAKGVLQITLNRPTVRNAVNAAVAQQVSAALDQLEQRDDLCIAILTGAGGYFCSGMDLKAYLQGEDPMVGDHSFMGFNERALAKPVIAAVEGPALAGGLEAVLACDMVVASSTARFGISEVKRGLAALGGGLVRLPRKIPPNIAMEMALTGEPIDAERAAQLGLVNRLTPPGQALAEALRLAQTIAANAPLSVKLSKRIVREQIDWPLDELVARQRAFDAVLMDSQDAVEGARAFAEKRPPRWTGR